MTPLSSRIDQIEPFVVMELLARAKALESQGRSIIHMEIGEPDFQTPGMITEAGIEALRQGRTKYTPAAGLPQLRQAIAEYYYDRYQVKVAAERIFITPGASGAFLLVLAAVLEPGSEILLSDPGYPCNRNFVRLMGGVPTLVPVTASTRFQLTEKSVRQHWQGATAGVWITSPSNPTGTQIERAELDGISKAVMERGGFLISDEIYHGLEYGRRSVSALELSRDAFVVNSFSKYFGMTGWRLGWLVAPETYIEALEKIAQNVFISAPSHSQWAALKAFDHRNLAELEERRSKFESRRDFLYDALIELGFRIDIKPDGAFYLYADCSAFTEDSDQFAWTLLDKAGVAITPGRDFGYAHSNHFVRFSYTTSKTQMQEGIARISAFLDRNQLS